MSPTSGPPRTNRRKNVAIDGRGRPITRLTLADDLPELLNVFEAAAWVGVHTDVIRSMIAGGALREVRFGRLVRTPKAALVAMMTASAEPAETTARPAASDKRLRRRS